MKKILIILALVGITKANAQDWSLTGNAGTDPAVNFIGSTDLKGFAIRTNNTNRIFVKDNGYVGIGTSSPTFQLQFNGAKFNLNATSTTASSLIKAKYKLEIQNGTTSTTFATFDAVNQRVGIGTTTPTTPLDVNGIITATGGNSSNWNSAFGWGNHASAGYLTSFSETDPQVGSITTNYVPRWNGASLTTGSIFDNAISVGIGTSTVTDSKFSVEQTGTSVATTKFLNTAKGPNISWSHFGTAGDWYIRSAANTGKVILQDQNAGALVHIGTISGSSKFNVSQTGTTISTAEFTNATKGPNASVVHFGLTGDWYIRSAANTGNVILQDQTSGTVCIGTTVPATGYKLSVKGKIICEELKVLLNASWPDYVFDNAYPLISMKELETYIQENKHLPGVPSASEIENNNGVSVGEMQTVLLKKLEEANLYILQLNKRIENLEAQSGK